MTFQPGNGLIQGRKLTYFKHNAAYRRHTASLMTVYCSVCYSYLCSYNFRLSDYQYKIQTR